MRVLFTPFFDGNAYQEMLKSNLEEEGVDVITDTSPHPLRNIIYKIRGEEIDVVHLHWTHPYFLFGSKSWAYNLPLSSTFSSFSAWWFYKQISIVKKMGVRVVWTVHNKYNHEGRYTSIDRNLSQKLASIVDEIQIWDENCKKEIIKYLSTPTPSFSIIPHGNYLPVLKDCPDYTQSEARQELGITEYEKVYLYFGEIRRYKGVGDLINWFLENGNREDCLLIAGRARKTDLKEELESRASEAANIITRFGFVERNQIPLYFEASSLCVFPYKKIFNSGSVVLCMSLGKPFLAPNLGSITSLSPTSIQIYDDLDEGMRRLQNYDSQKLKKIGAINLEKAKQDLSWGKITKKVVKSYRGGRGDSLS